MKSKKNIILIGVSIYFYYVFVSRLNTTGQLITSNDILDGILFNREKFGYEIIDYMVSIFPFLIFLGYPYILHIKNSDKNFIEFHRYRSSSSSEMFLLNLKYCLKYITAITTIVIIMMYLISFRFSKRWVFDLETMHLWIIIFSIIIVKHLFVNINIYYDFIDGVIALILIDLLVVTLLLLNMNMIYLIVPLLLLTIITFKKKRGGDI